MNVIGNVKNKICILTDDIIDSGGTIIISSEGVNGTISDKKNNLLKFNKLLKKILSIKKFNSENNSNSKFNPFHKPKVKIKKEVVPMGLCNLVC